MKTERLLKKKFYIFDETDQKYFQGFGSKKGKKVTYFSNSSYDYPVGYMTEKKCEEVLARIEEIRSTYGKEGHEYSVKDFQEYTRTYWRLERDGFAYGHAIPVVIPIKELATAKIDTDDLQSAMYYEQD